MRKAAVALVVLGAVFLVFGCGEPAEKLTPGELGQRSLEGANPDPIIKGEVVDGGTLVSRLGAEPDTLHPLTSTDVYSSRILEMVTDSLTEMDLDTFDLKPALAHSWEASQDHLTYTFHLRKDVKWHDGTPFTAADVVYSYERVVDPKVNAPNLRNYYQDLESVSAPDEYTVVFKWAKPYFLSLEFSASLPILPKHIFDDGQEFNTHPAGRKPVGNGAYKFVEWKTAEAIVLVRNEDYYGIRPHIKKRLVRFIADDNSALQHALTGAVDSLGVTPEQWVREVSKPAFREKFNKYYVYMNVFSYIGWNNRRAYFADKRVRRALTHLVDREGILENIYYGLGVIVTNPFYIYHEAYNKDIEPWPYDPERAKALLDEAGWTDSDGDGIRDKAIDGKSMKFSFTFMYPANRANARRTGELLQESLRRVGIEMELRGLEWATFLQRIHDREFDVVTLAWGSGTVDEDPYQIWHSSQAEEGSNYIGYVSDEVDRIIEEARTEFDEGKRNALYRRFNEILHDEQPYTFMYAGPGFMITNKRLHNIKVHKLRLDAREWYVPAELQGR